MDDVCDFNHYDYGDTSSGSLLYMFLDLTNPNLDDYFLFAQCCKSLERVSIPNAKHWNNNYGSRRALPQNA